jgi:exosortase
MDKVPLSNPLSIGIPFTEKCSLEMTEKSSKNLGWISTQLLGSPLPFGNEIRNTLSLVLLIALVTYFWQPLNALYALTEQEEHYSHIVLIPWLSLYVFYLDRKTILSAETWSPWLGSILLGIAGLWVWRADTATYGENLLTVTTLAFVMMCWGIFLFCYGVQAFRTNLFGLLILLWMVPFPVGLLNEVIVFLQRNSAEATDMVFSFLGIPFFREGFFFALPNIKIHVAQECSGIRSALSLIITSLVAGHFLLRSAWGKLALVAIVVPLAIVKNAFRIVGLTLLANYVDPSFLTNSILHRSGGIPLFAVSVAILLSLAWLLRNIEKRNGYFSSDQLRAKV